MVTPLQVILAIVVVAGGVVAVAAPNPRHATIGAFAAILLASLVADPLPSAAAVVARFAGALLGGWLLWNALRTAPAAAAHTALGWAGSAGVAVAAFAVGWLAATTLADSLPGSGAATSLAGQTLAGGSLVDRAAIGAAAALGVLSVAAVVVPRDGHRLGLGVMLLLAAGGLLAAALGTAPDDALEAALAILTAVTGAAVAAVATAMLRTGGDLVLREALAREPAVHHRAADEAHRSVAE